MQFLYHENASEQILDLDGDALKHIKAQRKRVGEILRVQNLREFKAYFYEICELGRKATLKLSRVKELSAQDYKGKIIWAVCDVSVIERTLAGLNELGLDELILVYSQYSQGNVRLDFARFGRILANSCEQCGRAKALKISLKNISEIDEKSTILLDFEGEIKDLKLSQNQTLFIGPEGGFSEAERQRFKHKIALNSPLILRSNTAIIACVAKMLL